MRSIDNLREYALTAASVNATTRAVLAGYIDEIEHDVGENERFRAEAEPFANRLRDAVEELADVTLFGVDYTALPVDADGVPIHVGDSIEIINGEPGTCVAIELLDRGDWLVSMRPTGWDTATLFTAEQVRHHHAPTVEDVLREFAHVGIRIAAKHGIKAGEIDFYADEEAIAEFAAKLRLAGDE